jgi:hypothetical protein
MFRIMAKARFSRVLRRPVHHRARLIRTITEGAESVLAVASEQF